MLNNNTVLLPGNGPSGINLSYVLAGHWPYYTGAAHSNELLTLRLQSDEAKNQSLLLKVSLYISNLLVIFFGWFLYGTSAQ
jgi:hypothetical protein